jgi:hypothetical protein
MSGISFLPKLFGQVVVPPEVLAELNRPNRPPGVRSFVASRPAWLLERVPAAVEAIPSFHAGEGTALGSAM